MTSFIATHWLALTLAYFLAVSVLLAFFYAAQEVARGPTHDEPGRDSQRQAERKSNHNGGIARQSGAVN